MVLRCTTAFKGDMLHAITDSIINPDQGSFCMQLFLEFIFINYEKERHTSNGSCTELISYLNYNTSSSVYIVLLSKRSNSVFLNRKLSKFRIV